MRSLNMTRRRMLAVAAAAAGVGAGAGRATPARAVECSQSGEFGLYEASANEANWTVVPESRSGLFLRFRGPAERVEIDIGASARSAAVLAANTTFADLRVIMRFPSGTIVTRPVAATVIDDRAGKVLIQGSIGGAEVAEQDQRIFDLLREDPFVRLTFGARRSRTVFFEDEQQFEGAVDALVFARSAHREIKAEIDCEDGGTFGICFLTTACCEAVVLPDDCWELRAARRFRDERLMRTEAGREDVARYYEIAPKIVAGLKAEPDADRRLARLYASRVLPTCALVAVGADRQAYRLYRRMVEELAARYL